MTDNARIYQQGLALILAALVVVGGAIVLLTMAIERAPAVAAVAFVIIVALLAAGVLMYRRDHHRMMTFVENVVAQRKPGEVIDAEPASVPMLPAPRKVLPFMARTPTVALRDQNGGEVEVSEKNLRRFIGMDEPSRAEWQGDNNAFAAIASNLTQRGFLHFNGKSYEWANGGRGQVRAQRSIETWLGEPQGAEVSTQSW